MEAKSKFNVGDTVYRITSGAVNTPIGIVCPACHGKGYVVLNEKRVTCKAVFQTDRPYPSIRYFCDYGQLAETKWKWKADDCLFLIDSVIAYDDTSDGSGLDISYEVINTELDDRIELNEDGLFATFEQALAEAEVRNNRYKTNQEVI